MSVCRASIRRALAFRPTTTIPRTFCPSSFTSSSLFSTSSASHNTAPAESKGGAAPAAATATQKPAALSSCPEGTVLVGLNYIKGKTDPVALRDDEYPAWLWDCLDVMKKASTEEDADAGDEFSKSKKQRRMARRRQRELEAKVLATGDLTVLAPKIPLQHQTVNLEASSTSTERLDETLAAAAKRNDLRVALRKERRAKIKEDNYLRSM